MKNKFLPLLLLTFFTSCGILSCTKEELIDIESIIEETTEVVETPEEVEETTEESTEETTEESTEESTEEADNILSPIMRDYTLYKDSYLNQKSGMAFVWSDNRSNMQGFTPRMHNTTNKEIHWYGNGQVYHDIDNDGYQDILVSCHNTYGDTWLTWYMNEGDNFNFTSDTSKIIGSTDGMSSHKFVKTDVNNDNIADFISFGVYEPPVGDFNGNLTVLIGNGDGTFRVNNVPNPNKYWFHNGAAGDLNGDGNVDVVGATFIWWGDGNGNFTKQENFVLDTYNESPLVYEIVDFNQDGMSDIILKGPWKNTTIVLNNNGTFNEYNQTIVLQPDASFKAVMDIEIVDFDNDGDLDIIELAQRGGNTNEDSRPYHFASKILVYYNNNYSFTLDEEILSESLDGDYLHGDSDKFGWSTFKFDDIDGDGIDDIIAENYHDGEPYNALKKIDGMWKKVTFKFGKDEN